MVLLYDDDVCDGTASATFPYGKDPADACVSELQVGDSHIFILFILYICMYIYYIVLYCIVYMYIGVPKIV